MTVHEAKLFDKWMNLRSAGMEKSDVFEIIDQEDAMEYKTYSQASIEELPPEFFDFFMVIKAS